MSVRQVLNLTYAQLVEGKDLEAKEVFDRQLQEPFDWELTPEEQKKAKARRMLEARGQSGDPSEVMRYMQRG